jgi:serine-type D-Ala-D-Ala carboxypeptidase
MTLNTKLAQIIEEARIQGVASSISLFVGFPTDASDITIHAGFTDPGVTTSDHSIYDLASLTKMIGTTIAVAKAIDDQIIAIDERPFQAWPHASIKTLLAHTAGLPAHVRFHENLSGTDFENCRQRIKQELFTLSTHDTAERVYSDTGFIALGFLLEERLKKPLFEIFSDAWSALGTSSDFMWFASQDENPSNLSLIAKTYCYARNQRLRAQVHDYNCYFLGGLAGHAGLFGNLASVTTFGQRLLKVIKTPKNNLHKILADFACQGLGFDKPTATGSNSCLSTHAFGHFGYTGTSLWIDPDYGPNGVVIALLTNRINESDKPEGIFWLRSAVNQAVMREQSAS